MVRIMVREAYDGERDYIEAACTSGDTPPVGKFINGSWVLQVDTGKVRFYNEDTESWGEV